METLYISTKLGLAVIVDETRGFMPTPIEAFGSIRTTKLDGIEVTEFERYTNSNFVQDAADILRHSGSTLAIAL